MDHMFAEIKMLQNALKQLCFEPDFSVTISTFYSVKKTRISFAWITIYVRLLDSKRHSNYRGLRDRVVLEVLTVQ